MPVLSVPHPIPSHQRATSINDAFELVYLKNCLVYELAKLVHKDRYTSSAQLAWLVPNKYVNDHIRIDPKLSHYKYMCWY